MSHFRLLEHQNLRMNLQKGSSFWETLYGALSPDSVPGLRLWSPVSNVRPPDLKA